MDSASPALSSVTETRTVRTEVTRKAAVAVSVRYSPETFLVGGPFLGNEAKVGSCQMLKQDSHTDHSRLPKTVVLTALVSQKTLSCHKYNSQATYTEKSLLTVKSRG